MASRDVRVHIGRLVFQAEAGARSAPKRADLAGSIGSAMLDRLSPSVRSPAQENGNELANAIADGLLQHRAMARLLSGG